VPGDQGGHAHRPGAPLARPDGRERRRIADGEATIEEVGWELFHLMLDVASGREDLGRALEAAQRAGAVQPGAGDLTT
jgi:hypothetical protein